MQIILQIWLSSWNYLILIVELPFGLSFHVEIIPFLMSILPVQLVPNFNWFILLLSSFSIVWFTLQAEFIIWNYIILILNDGLHLEYSYQVGNILFKSRDVNQIDFSSLNYLIRKIWLPSELSSQITIIIFLALVNIQIEFSCWNYSIPNVHFTRKISS